MGFEKLFAIVQYINYSRYIFIQSNDRSTGK